MISFYPCQGSAREKFKFHQAGSWSFSPGALPIQVAPAEEGQERNPSGISLLSWYVGEWADQVQKISLKEMGPGDQGIF